MSGKESIPYSGINTFLGRGFKRVLDGDEDIVIVGVPYDSGASYKVGARFGPSAIRKASMIMKFYAGDSGLMDSWRGVRILRGVNIVDYGDIEVPFGDTKLAYKIIKDKVIDLLKFNSIKIFLGGDHSITYPIVEAYLSKYPDLRLVHIDAHLDILRSYAGVEYTHASHIYNIINKAGMKPENIIQIGIRGYVNSPESYEYASKIGLNIFSIDTVRRKGLDSVMKEILEILNDSPIYITFDVDSLYPSIAPATGVIEPDGLRYYEAKAILNRLGELKIVGADFVELAPDYDINDITAKTIVYLIIDLISRYKVD